MPHRPPLSSPLAAGTVLLLLGLAIGCSRTTSAPAGSEAGPEGNATLSADYMKQYDHIPWVEVGRSVRNQPIYMAEFGEGEDVTLFFSCFHGNERITPEFGLQFADLIHKDPSLIAEGKKVVVIPILNPDGYDDRTRNNANDVDLNRNYPTGNWGQQPEDRHVDFGPQPASEPETRTVLKLMADVQPDKILSIHQPLECNNSDGPAGIPLAELMAQYNGYPVEPYIGYPTPGSYGTYAGKEREIPMVTLELPRARPNTEQSAKIWEENREALLAVVNCNLAELPPPSVEEAGEWVPVVKN